VEETRHSHVLERTCYQKWKKLVLEGNMLRGILQPGRDAKEQTAGQDWQDRLAYKMFWVKGLINQTTDAYDLLPQTQRVRRHLRWSRC